MSAILYGNLGVEIASRHGARLTRMTLRQNPADLLRPQRPDVEREAVATRNDLDTPFAHADDVFVAAVVG